MVIPALVLGAFLPALAGAQEAAKPAAKPEARAPRIAVLDIDKVWAESLLGKSFTSQLEAQQNELNSLRTKKETELNKMQADLKAAQEDLEKKQTVLGPEALEKLQHDLNKKQRDIEDFVTEGKQEVGRLTQGLQQKQAQVQNEFLQKVQPSIELVSKERSVDILLHKQATFLQPAKDFDITQDVIVKVDDAERLRSKAGAAAAPATAPAKATGPAAKPVGPSPAPSPKPNH
jgi:Skp family chaperone for outer membrane proteins